MLRKVTMLLLLLIFCVPVASAQPLLPRQTYTGFPTRGFYSDLIANLTHYCFSTSPANTYVCTVDNGQGVSLSWVSGQLLVLQVVNTNTANAIVSINGGSPIAIKTFVGGTLTDVQAGDLPAGKHIDLRYDGTNFQLVAGRSASTSGTVTQVSPATGGGTLANLGTFGFSAQTSTPTLTIGLTNAGAHTFWGNNTGSGAAPNYVPLTASDLPSTAVTPGTYGSATAIPACTFDAQGRATGCSTVTPQLTLTSTYFSSLSGANLTALPAAQLSGTIPSATQDLITRTGTLVSGATGAGFTLALSTSTVTGNLAVARLNSGTGASPTTFWRGDGTWSDPPGYFNVRTYGATGNGTTDDHAAIVAAQAAAVAAGGGTVYFPCGTYVNSARVDITASNINVRGEGKCSVWKATPGVPSPLQLVAINFSNIHISDMAFLGNGVIPVVSGSSPAALTFNGCSNVTLDHIKMSAFQGIGIAIGSGSSNVKVINSTFIDMGQDQIGLTPKGGTVAIWVGGGSSYSKVKDNYFENCHWGAVYLFGSFTIVSGNHIKHCSETGIFGGWEANSTGHNVISNNIITDIYLDDISSHGIEWSGNDTVISGNRISYTEGAGIVVSAASNVAVVGNNVSNAGNKAGVVGGIPNMAGIMLQNNTAHANPSKGYGITIADNVIFDDQVTTVQKYGISVSSYPSPTAYTGVKIVNNSNVHSEIPIYVEPGSLDDKSNTFYGNQGWPDVQRSVASVATTAVTTEQYLLATSIPANSMAKTWGFRFETSGTITGTNGSKTVRAKHNGGLDFGVIIFTAGETGVWLIEGTIMNSGGIHAQTRTAKLYKNGNLYAVVEDTAAIFTEVDDSFYVSIQLANASDSGTVKKLIVTAVR